MSEPIFVADIGGTNARFGIAEIVGASVRVSSLKSFRAGQFDSIQDAAHSYLQEVGVHPRNACFAAAGPLSDGEVKFTNAKWKLRVGDISGPLGIENIKILNDFEALAAGVEHLPEKGLVEVKPGRPDPTAPMLVLGPGTGFGQAIVIPDDEHDRIIATEGGHVEFSAQSEDEDCVKRFVLQKHSRVSVERLLSGVGLSTIYAAISARKANNPIFLDPSEITSSAINGLDPLSVQSVEIFCSVLGRVAGDAALATGARGGVIIGGGIVPRIQKLFLASSFVDELEKKGRMKEYVSAIPVRLIVEDGAALYGAAVLAEY